MRAFGAHGNRRSIADGRLAALHAGIMLEAVARSEQRAQLFVAHCVQRDLALKAVFHMLNDNEEGDDRNKPQQPHREHHDLLARAPQSHRGREQNGDDHAQRICAMLQFRVKLHESRGMLQQVGAEFFVVAHGAHNLSRPVTAFGQLHFLAVHDVAFRELLGEHAIKVREEGARKGADEQENREEQREHAYEAEPHVPVEAADAFAHGVDAIREREDRIHRLKEARGELNGVQARSARDLHKHQNDAQALAHMLQRGGKRVLNRQVRKRARDRCYIERGDVFGLHAKEQAARHAHDGLQRNHDGEQNAAAQETLRDGEVANLLIVDLDMHNDHEHKHADPQREVDEQRRHGRAIRVERIKLLGFELRGRLHEVGDFVHVERAVFAEQLRESARRAERHHVGSHGVDIALHVGEQRIGLAQCINRRVERRDELVEHERRLIDERRLAGDRARKRTRRARKAREALAYSGDGVFRQVVIVRAAVVGRFLHRIIHGT